mmetsp:Transcript_8382/g.25194  ORF Transcript_8382/g.25194 Transcript_8382/m.25194 type:complete len:233 (+) Transcript_8382:2559-3257(+)
MFHSQCGLRLFFVLSEIAHFSTDPPARTMITESTLTANMVSNGPVRLSLRKFEEIDEKNLSTVLSERPPPSKLSHSGPLLSKVITPNPLLASTTPTACSPIMQISSTLAPSGMYMSWNRSWSYTRTNPAPVPTASIVPPIATFTLSARGSFTVLLTAPLLKSRTNPLPAAARKHSPPEAQTAVPQLLTAIASSTSSANRRVNPPLSIPPSKTASTTYSLPLLNAGPSALNCL